MRGCVLKIFIAGAALIATAGAAPADGVASDGVSAMAADAPMVGGAALGRAFGGVTDRAFVIGPPHWSVAVHRSSGAFLDCGAQSEAAQIDDTGAVRVALDCGVTLTETVSVPNLGEKARFVVHF